GRGQGALRGHRGVGPGGVAGRTEEGATDGDVPATAGETSDDSEARRRRATARHPDDSGPGGADGRETGAGTALRGGSEQQCLRLPTGAQRPGRSRGSAPSAL